MRENTAERAEKLRALGAEETFPKYDPLDNGQVNLRGKGTRVVRLRCPNTDSVGASIKANGFKMYRMYTS